MDSPSSQLREQTEERARLESLMLDKWSCTDVYSHTLEMRGQGYSDVFIANRQTGGVLMHSL